MKIINMLVLLWLCCVAAKAHADDSSTDKYVGTREHRLDNGLLVVLNPMPQAKEIHVNVVYGTGSLADPPGRGGTAHLLEHLMFQDTWQRSTRQIREGLREHGIQFGATTSYDRTRYTTVFEVSDAALDYALEWEAERMAGLAIQSEGLEIERQATLTEIEETERDALSALSNRMLTAMSPGQGVGRLVFGSRSKVATLTGEELDRFHRAHYHPRNATLVIVGQFDEQAAMRLVHRHFGSLTSPPAQTSDNPSPSRADPISGGDEVRMVQGEQAWVGLLFPMPPVSDPSGTVMPAFLSILVNAPEGRLYRALVESGDATTVAMNHFSFRNSGYAFFSAMTPDPNKLPQLRQRLLDELTGFADRPVSDEEMERFRRYSQDLQSDVKQQGLAAFSGELAHVLAEGAGLGDWRRLIDWYDAADSVQRDVMQVEALRLFDPARATTGYLLPAP